MLYPSNLLTAHTIKSHFKALGLYNFIRGFGWAYMYKWGVGGLTSGWAYKRNKKCLKDEIKCKNKELKLTYQMLHFELHL